MSTEETLWANRNVALLARLYKVRGLRVEWSIADQDLYALRLAGSEKVVTATIDRGALSRSLKGIEQDQAAMIRTLTSLVRSLSV
jgi:hypothetical protein